MSQLKIFLIGIQFYTRIPITGGLANWVGFEASWISRATRFFPLIGLLVALLMSAFFWLASQMTVHGVALPLTLAFGVLLTGAFHEDGFADFCDGFGGGNTPEQILTIMRDSRIGAYGTLGVTFIILIKYASLWGKPFFSVCLALCFAHVVSRAAAVIIMSTLPYVETSIGNKTATPIKPVAQQLNWVDQLLPLITVVVVSLVCLKYGLNLRAFGLALVLCSVVIIWMHLNLKRRLGGYTGDTLGATQQLCEVVCLVALANPY